MQISSLVFSMYLILAFVAFLILIFIAAGLKVLRESERVVILRLGRFHSVKGPGIIFMAPLFERIALKVSIQEQATGIDTQAFKGTVHWHIVDVEKYAFTIGNRSNDVDRAIQESSKKIAESMAGNSLFGKSNDAASDIKAVLESKFREWGLAVTEVDLQT
jgi:regulator of protease activity HflC (stomatin/prohibitin superfamily)